MKLLVNGFLFFIVLAGLFLEFLAGFDALIK